MATSKELGDSLIERLSWTPLRVDNNLFKDIPRVTFSTVDREHAASNAIGTLSTMPLELLQQIISQIDLKDLISFSQTCLKARKAVQSLLPFQILLQHSPQTLHVIGKMGLMRKLTAKRALEIMHNSKCATCELDGPFLSLINGKRCCYQCLRTNDTLWTVTEEVVRKVLGPSGAEDITRRAGAPVFETPNGLQFYSWQTLLLHTNIFPNDRNRAGYHGDRSSDPTEGMAPLLNARSFKMLHYHPSFALHRLIDSNSCFCRIAAVPFPIITPDSTRTGLWCRGCDQMYSFMNDEISLQVSSLSQDAARDRRQELYWQSLRGYTAEGFLEHLYSCEGAGEVMYAGELKWMLKRLRKLQTEEKATSHLRKEPKPEMSKEHKAELMVAEHIRRLDRVVDGTDWTAPLKLKW